MKRIIGIFVLLALFFTSCSNQAKVRKLSGSVWEASSDMSDNASVVIANSTLVFDDDSALDVGTGAFEESMTINASHEAANGLNGALVNVVCEGTFDVEGERLLLIYNLDTIDVDLEDINLGDNEGTSKALSLLGNSVISAMKGTIVEGVKKYLKDELKETDASGNPIRELLIKDNHLVYTTSNGEVIKYSKK